MNEIAGDPARAKAMGVAGRERAVTEFGWDTIAERTMQVYSSAVQTHA